MCAAYIRRGGKMCEVLGEPDDEPEYTVQFGSYDVAYTEEQLELQQELENQEEAEEDSESEHDSAAGEYLDSDVNRYEKCLTDKPRRKEKVKVNKAKFVEIVDDLLCPITIQSIRRPTGELHSKYKQFIYDIRSCRQFSEEQFTLYCSRLVCYLCECQFQHSELWKIIDFLNTELQQSQFVKLFVQQYYPVFNLDEMTRIDRTLGHKYQVNERVFSLVYKVIENDTVTVEQAGIESVFTDKQKFDIGFETLMGLVEYACNRRSR